MHRFPIGVLERHFRIVTPKTHTATASVVADIHTGTHPRRIRLIQRIVRHVAVGIDGLGGTGVANQRIGTQEPPEAGIVEARVVVILFLDSSQADLDQPYSARFLVLPHSLSR